MTMNITLDVKKTVEENAQVYFEKSKKSKKKIEGVKEAIALYTKKLEDLKQKESDELGAFKDMNEKIQAKKAIKREWYEKFKWFISSEGFLCISGSDATSNEIVVKKHMSEKDIVFHSEMSGSPFTIVKTEGKMPGKATLNEAAQFTAVYSRAWRQGISGVDVFWVNPDQVSKTPNTGEYVGKGSFIIRGKVNNIRPDMEICIGIKEGRILAGTRDVMKAYAEKYVVLIQDAKAKTSDVAKKIKHKLSAGDLDDIGRFIPSGGAKIKESVGC